MLIYNHLFHSLQFTIFTVEFTYYNNCCKINSQNTVIMYLTYLIIYLNIHNTDQLFLLLLSNYWAKSATFLNDST